MSTRTSPEVLKRNLEEARTRYHAHEKKALSKPTGFYENKLESLTDIIITYERHQHEKTRRLQQLHQVRSKFKVPKFGPIVYGSFP